MEEIFNSVVIKEKEGINEIKIDGTKLKAVSVYEIKRDTDIVNLTFSMSVPPEKLKFTEN